jgi:hypothetical protein
MKRRLVVWLTAPTLVVATALSYWLVRGTRSGDVPRTADVRLIGAPASAADPRLRQVLELMRKKDDPATWTELIALYGRLAADPSALGVRASVLNAVFNEPAQALRLKRALEAIDADPTPPAQDPLWPELAHRLSEQWSGDAFSKGRDLMLMEKRERPRRALIDSFTELALSDRVAGLQPDEAQALLSDLIDIHAQATPEQRPRIQEAVRKLGGNDPADLLAGRGLTADKKLELQVEYERNLQAGIESLMKGQPDKAE